MSTLRRAGEDRLHITTCGREACTGGHQYGPAVRAYYLIHYVLSGCGEYVVKGRRYTLSAGQGFIIFPGEVTTYRADDEQPWHYVWLGYAGGDAAHLTALAGLTPDHPVFSHPQIEAVNGIISAASEDIRTLRMGAESAAGGVMRLLAQIGEQNVPRGAENARGALLAYYQKATWYIEGSLTQGVTVSDVASFVGLCRSQLFRVFRAAGGLSPQEWIQQARLRRAEELLMTPLTLSEIAVSSGFSGEPQMSAAFRKHRGMSPSEYRRSVREWPDKGQETDTEAKKDWVL